MREIIFRENPLPKVNGCMEIYKFPKLHMINISCGTMSGKGTWESNPWVVAYSFELVD